MSDQFPHISAKIIQPGAFLVTVWFHESAEAKPVVLVKNEWAGSIEDAKEIIRRVAAEKGIHEVDPDDIDVSGID
jgi:hypothetical protein